ncbi:hypothetical protein Psta_1161 [Pirellula staleyi DSM 6068]|uniref:Uncharacterized protein n=1 Tax=Pirellula staleyi (strain ATCC 27377 / DSM 6068 / ICPB 4128) TaxID=530564 RepID=D2R916_PIRSD|nr:hypothetical protein [Pirellula staleyi]ADB15843.1 hypothetical protein Psta_1161 [Pirellula staleyi DSM 6068]
MIAGPRREITQLIIQHRVYLLTYVKEIFQQGWPATDSEVATEAALANHIDRMAGELEGVLKRLRRRLLWAFREVQRLNKVREQQATLEQEGEAHFRRCDRLIKKLKGVQSKRRREAEGVDDINTYGVLAAEGYLPGYGLDTGSVVAMAEVLRLAKVSDRVYMVAEWPQANAGHYQLELNWPGGSEQRVVTIAPKKISASWMSFSANESVTDSLSAGSSSVCEAQAGEIALGECWAQGGCSAPSIAKHRRVHSCGPACVARWVQGKDSRHLLSTKTCDFHTWAGISIRRAIPSKVPELNTS